MKRADDYGEDDNDIRDLVDDTTESFSTQFESGTGVVPSTNGCFQAVVLQQDVQHPFHTTTDVPVAYESVQMVTVVRHRGSTSNTPIRLSSRLNGVVVE